MVYYSYMNRLGGGFCVAALLAALPLTAAAQAVEVSFHTMPAPATEKARAPELLKMGDPLPVFSLDPAPFRPNLSFEISTEERERRHEELSKCGLLSGIRGRSALDVIAGLPNGMIDWVAGGLRGTPDRGDACSLRSPEDASLLSRVFSGPVQDASEHPFDDLMNQLLVREQKYFARFQDSDLSTVAVESGDQDIDSDGLMAAQRKILFDAARKLYFGRLGNRMDDRIRDESFDISRWHPIDYAVAPALIAGYLYVRGWEKKVDVMGLKCCFQMEPIRRILERFEGSHNDLVSAASLEIGVGNFPVKAIISLGIQDGDPLLDFVGIGTSIGKAKQVVSQALGESEE